MQPFVTFVDKKENVLIRFFRESNPNKWIDSLFVLYLYWVAFEWTFVSRIPSYALIQTIRNGLDIVPLALFFLSVVILNPKFRSTDLKILIGFLIIIILSALSIFLEGRSPGLVRFYIGVTVRFVPFLFLVRLTSPDFSARLFRNVKIVYSLLAGLALLNLIGKEWFINTFLPNPDIFTDTLPTAYNDPGISASFKNTVEFSFFFVALTVVYLYNESDRRTRLLVSIVSLVLIVLSFSIASILALLLVFFIRSTRKLLMACLLSSVLIIAVWSFNDLFLQLLGMDFKYWIEISSEFNRLGYLTKVFPEFLHGSLKDLFLGMGFDGGIINMKLAAYKNTPWVMINNENNFTYLKDVYWLSILLSQGLISLVATFYIVIKVWAEARSTGTENAFQMVKVFILLALFLGMFNQILEMKGFTYFFWLMAGMAMYKPEPRTAVAMA